MKRKIANITLTIGLMLTITGCEKEQSTTFHNEVAGVESSKQEAVESVGTIDKDETSNVPNEGDISEEMGESMEGDKEDDSSMVEAQTLAENPVTIENPSWDYYIADESKVVKELSIRLEELSQEPNEIIDEEDWFNSNDLPLPWNVDYNGEFPNNEDEIYRYKMGGEPGDWYMLNILDKATDTFCYRLDFSEYRYANDFLPEDEPFVGQSVWYAQIVDNVLYASIGHLTYAKSSPHNAYIVAIDLDDMSVLWKTKPLVSNAYSFAVVGDYIISGYGFTAEKDYINVIDKETGVVMKEYPIKSMAEYIIYKNDILYVRSYNMNYTYQIVDVTK